MVTFGSVLHRMHETDDVDGSVTLDFYWDHWSISNLVNGKYSNDAFNEFIGSNNCKSGGDATLAFAIFAFLAFLIHITTAFCRVAGFNFPLARDTQHSLYIELVLSSIELFCFFLQVTIWGGTCFTASRSAGSVTGVGYGLIIACFFFLIINEILYVMMRSNDDLVLGNGATRGGGGGSANAYSSEGGGGDYGGDSAGQPTFSYQGGSETQGNSL